MQAVVQTMEALIHFSKSGMAAGTAAIMAVAGGQVPLEAGKQGELAHQEAQRGHMFRPIDATSALHIASDHLRFLKLRQ